MASTSSDSRRGTLEDADHFLAQAAQAVDGVLAGEAIGDGGQQQDQRQVGPVDGDRRGFLVESEPAALEATE